MKTKSRIGPLREIGAYWAGQFLVSWAAIIVFSSLLSLSAMANPIFSKATFNEIKDVSEQLLAQYPLEDHVFIGIGRSPTVFTTYLKERGAVTINLPLSKFRPGLPGTRANVLSVSQENYLFEHFEHILEDLESWKGKTLVFIDYTKSGASLIAAVAYFRYYLEERRSELLPSIAAIGVALVGRHNTELLTDILDSEGHSRVSLSGFATLSSLLLDAAFEDFAEYGEFLVTRLQPSREHDYVPPVKNEAYSRMVSTIREYILEDEKVKSLLRGDQAPITSCRQWLRSKIN